MKFWQALRAMERGKEVRLKGWAPQFTIHLDRVGNVFRYRDGNTCKWRILARVDDWVIVRKKKKAPKPTPPPPPPPLPRNIFTDPRVGDEFGDAHSTWRVIGVSYYQVAYKCVKICGHPGEHLYLVRRDYFVEYGSACATIARAPEEEVGSPDAK